MFCNLKELETHIPGWWILTLFGRLYSYLHATEIPFEWSAPRLSSGALPYVACPLWPLSWSTNNLCTFGHPGVVSHDSIGAVTVVHIRLHYKGAQLVGLLYRSRFVLHAHPKPSDDHLEVTLSIRPNHSTASGRLHLCMQIQLKFEAFLVLKVVQRTCYI